MSGRAAVQRSGECSRGGIKAKVSAAAADDGPGSLGDESCPTQQNITSFHPVQHQIATRSVTGRLVRKTKKEFSPASSPPRKQAKASSSTTGVNSSTPEQTKTRRQWELWSTNDTNVFFEALSEHGRDFDAIQAAISNKHKKKGTAEAMSKTKEQIRHFYYRTWHKISKHIEKTDGVSKHAMELYGLINFGELRKKIGNKIDDKKGMQLNELVHHGTTVVKPRGKKIRVKTPVCRALKKLNNREEVQQDVSSGLQVPDQVTIELRPRTNAAWTHVQMMSHNPRLRLCLKSSRSLASLVDFLNAKWKPERVRLKEKLGEKEDCRKEIKLHLPADSTLTPYTIQPTSCGTDKLDFTHYLQHVKHFAPNNSSPVSKKSKSSKDEESRTADGDPARPKTILSPVKSDDNEVSVSSPVASNNCMSTPIPDNSEPEKTSHLNPVCNGEVKTETSQTIVPPEKAPNANDFGAGAKKMALLQDGMTRSGASELKVAELLLMLGCPGRVHLEYEWVDCKPVRNILDLKNLTNMLQRLIHLATTEFTDFRQSKSPPVPRSDSKTQCTCGAAGDSKYRTPPNNKSASRGAAKGTLSPALLLPKPPKNSPSTPKANGLPDSPATPKTPGGAPSTPKSGRDLQSTGDSPMATALSTSPSGESVQQASSDVARPDTVFRVPMAVPPRIMPKPQQQGVNIMDKHSLMAKHPELFMPKRLHRMRRNIRKPIVVQRTLLPKTEEPSRQIMTLTMLSDSKSSQSASFMPVVASPAYTIQPSNSTTETTSKITNQDTASFSSANKETSSAEVQNSTVTVEAKTTQAMKGKRRIIPTPLPSTCEPATFPPASVMRNSSNLLQKAAASADIISMTTDSPLTSTSSPANDNSDGLQANSAHVPQEIAGLDAFLPDTGVSGTPSQRSQSPITSLLDISLPEAADVSESTDKLLDLALANSSNSFTGLLAEANGECEKASDQLGAGKLLRNSSGAAGNGLAAEEQWLNGEDFNLSNFLESPLKKPTTTAVSMATTSLFSDASRDSVILGRLDVDTTLQCMMNENSMDYISKFADLAAQIASQEGSQSGNVPTSLSAE